MYAIVKTGGKQYMVEQGNKILVEKLNVAEGDTVSLEVVALSDNGDVKTGDAADCIGLPNIHQEVKCVEKLNVYDAYNQANRDAKVAGKGEIPIVAWKRKYKPFLVVMSADDFFRIYKESEWSEEHGS